MPSTAEAPRTRDDPITKKTVRRLTFSWDAKGAARFEVELDTADLDGVFRVQAVMEDWEERASSYLVFPIIPTFQYSIISFSKSSQLARADLDPQGLAGRGDFHFP